MSDTPPGGTSVTQFVVVFMAALVVALAVMPLARQVALHTGMVDRPSPRKIHLLPTPLLGGVALYVAVAVAVAVFSDQVLNQLASIVIGASLVSLLGLWDDRRGIRPLFKLCGQIAAALLLPATGVQVLLVPVEWVNWLVTVLWVVGVTNAVNLLDNMDGLSAGVAAIAAAFFFLLASLSGQFLIASLSVAIVGACLGFLRHNLNPARIFMGDAGSLFLGFILAALGIKLRFANVLMVSWMIPIFVLALPIFDTTLVTISRLRRGLNPLTTPGTDHLSHRLLTLGLNQREAVLIQYLASCFAGMLALALVQANVWEAYIMGVALLIGGCYALVRLERQAPVYARAPETAPPTGDLATERTGTSTHPASGVGTGRSV
ncbi:MAG: undecaprenyl/decaprenyl-phosphate alpha-N-acetylglucosaminyl 1-phosphate transferase [Chloroflexi bacterium]|nr:undecaprenyl/decaprenyl-phosphate alpha-N-acetylglucosaminyl 1-phosphate transferase [Chloroflexota bacterium]